MLAAIEQSLLYYPSSVMELSVDEILNPNGYVAELRQRGYAIEKP